MKITATSVVMLDAVLIIKLLVRINAAEIAARNIPMYRLALLRRNWVNSALMTLLYLTSKMSIDTTVNKTITNVYVNSSQ